MVLEKTLNKEELNFDDIKYLLQLKKPEEIDKLFKKAYEVKEREVGKKVFYRGLIEYSNICTKNCNYCGIRLDNKKVPRYCMTDEEVIEAAIAAKDFRYASIVIQSGERSDPAFADKIIDLLTRIHKVTDNTLGVTLSIGEHSKETYQKLYDAGARRFLLRIETSNPELYKKLHPASHSFEERIKCLRYLQETGFQTGTGVMIGLPGQTVDDLARDILFFKEMDIDMVGMGPFIEHEATPMGENDGSLTLQERFDLTLRMIAVLRIVMKDINIAAATALQAIEYTGREKGLKAGANVIMPNLTPTKYRENYLLYENKPCTDEDASQCRGCLEGRIKSVGDEIGYDVWGDSRHFFKRTGKEPTKN